MASTRLPALSSLFSINLIRPYTFLTLSFIAACWMPAPSFNPRNSMLMSLLHVFTILRRPCCWSSSLAKVFEVIHIEEMIQLAVLGHIPVSAIVEHQAKWRARAIQKSRDDSESPGKMLHLIFICLKEIDPREWLSCRVVLQDFIFSAMNLVIVGHTLYISSVFSTQEWGILSNAFL